MRILIANANTTETITQRCADVARAAVGPDTIIQAVTPRFGPSVITSRVEEAIASHAILDCLAEHQAGCDAIVLAVSLDTGLGAARQAFGVPVVGMTEAACMTACMTGARFGLVTFGRSIETYRELVDRHGLLGRCAGMRAIPIDPADSLARPDATRRAVQAEAQRLVEDGADSVVLAGAALAGMAKDLDLPVPPIDGIACAVRLAEALVGIGLKKPRSGSHVPVAERRSVGLSPHLAALLQGPA